ncbi:MAG: hypothetical protein AAF280_00900 [Pseudomonadota bacterium]
MAFGVILFGSVAGLLAAIMAGFLGHSLWAVLGVYVAASLSASAIVAVLLVLKNLAAKRRNLDTGAQDWAVKSSK